MATRPAMFKWRQTEPALILCAVRWYLRYSLSLRDVEELLEERGLQADHTTVWRWVQRYSPELEWRACGGISSRTTKSWRVDETLLARIYDPWHIPTMPRSIPQPVSMAGNYAYAPASLLRSGVRR